MKRVILVRHAESAAQQFSRKERWDFQNEAVRDPYLSPTGVRQASELGDHWKTLGSPPALVVCSALSRAIQTAGLLFPADKNACIVVHPDLRESSPGGQKAVGKPAQLECRGRLLQDLKDDPQLAFGNIDWSLVPENAWWSDSVESTAALDARLRNFSVWLEQRQESAAIVISHFHIIARLLSIGHVKNCKPIYCIMQGLDWAHVEHPRTSLVDFWASSNSRQDVNKPTFSRNSTTGVETSVIPIDSASVSTIGDHPIDTCEKRKSRRWGKALAKEKMRDCDPPPSIVSEEQLSHGDCEQIAFSLQKRPTEGVLPS